MNGRLHDLIMGPGLYGGRVTPIIEGTSLVEQSLTKLVYLETFQCCQFKCFKRKKFYRSIFFKTRLKIAIKIVFTSMRRRVLFVLENGKTWNEEKKDFFFP